MPDRYSRLFAEAAEHYDSAEEAWNATKEAREQVDWDPDAVRVGGSSDSEFQFQTVASDD